MTDQYYTARAMTKYGGSFARALADAWFAADPVNRRRIETAFPDYFTKYAALAEQPAPEACNAIGESS